VFGLPGRNIMLHCWLLHRSVLLSFFFFAVINLFDQLEKMFWLAPVNFPSGMSDAKGS
jgi:hypothetical protein